MQGREFEFRIQDEVVKSVFCVRKDRNFFFKEAGYGPNLKKYNWMSSFSFYRCIKYLHKNFECNKVRLDLMPDMNRLTQLAQHIAF